MKRILYTLTIMAIVCSAIAWATENKDFVFELGELRITYDPNDPNDYTVAEKRLYYLTAHPIPLDPNGVETMTEKQWYERNGIEVVAAKMAMWMNRGKGQLLARKVIKAKKVFKSNSKVQRINDNE